MAPPVKRKSGDVLDGTIDALLPGIAGALARRVATDVRNTLRPAATRLPLGTTRSHDDASGTAISVFKVRVPTKAGGTLRVALIDPEAKASFSIREEYDSSDISKADHANAISHAFEEGRQGFYYVVVGRGNATVSCEFYQDGHSRYGSERSAPPLVPWNFWYWPSSRSAEHKVAASILTEAEQELWKHGHLPDEKNYWTWKARQILDRYGKATRTDSAARAELGSHQRSGQGKWEGHCEEAATSSVLFEVPQSGLIGGLWFQGWELAYLLAEWCRAYAPESTREIVFTLWNPTVDRAEDPLCYANPFDVLTLESILARAKAADVTASQEAAIQGRYEKVLKNVEGANSALGRAGASFLGTLIREVKQRGEPLLTDLRSEDSASEIWNHVLFRYEAWFTEADSSKDDDLHYNIDLVAYHNGDAPPPIVFPADVEGGKPIPNQNSVPVRHLLRIRFTTNGQIDESASDNRWARTDWGAGWAKTRFPPRYLMRFGKPLPKDQYEDLWVAEDPKDPTSSKFPETRGNVISDLLTQATFRRRGRYV